jgi:solute carrier family 32 (vesicular inhibitory amino acid transporter)
MSSSALSPLIGDQNENILQAHHHNGVTKTVLFIIAEMAGGGIVALPSAMKAASIWAGLGTMLAAGILAAFSGTLLSRCFQAVTEEHRDQLERAVLIEQSPAPHALTSRILHVNKLQPVPIEDQQTFIDYRKYPYVFIGREALGAVGEYAVLFSQLVSLTGVATVFIIIAAGNLLDITNTLTLKWWIVIVSVSVLPISWLESPKDFWQSAAVAVASTVIVAIAVSILVVVEKPDHFVDPPTATFDSYFTAFGTVVFSFGGAALFPTLQTDMKHPEKFNTAIVIGFLCIFAMYIPVSTTAYFTFGDEISGNILLNLHSDLSVCTCDMYYLI